MLDPRLEDHAVGLEMQILELEERRKRAAVQGRVEEAGRIEHELDELQQELTLTAEQLAS